MLLSVVGFGANLFIIIVAILIGIGMGLTTIDFLRTKEKEKKWEKADQENTENQSV